jgi:hypothetical protein
MVPRPLSTTNAVPSASVSVRSSETIFQVSRRELSRRVDFEAMQAARSQDVRKYSRVNAAMSS